MQGRYLHIVADMSQHVSTADDSDEVSICSVGIFGTKYVRNGEPLPEVVEVTKGQTLTVSIEKIQSAFSIANSLDIRLRQATNLSFIQITENSSTSDVLIDADGQLTGEYTLTLESFNALSIAQSTLKTDTITINIIEESVQLTQPSFSD